MVHENSMQCLILILNVVLCRLASYSLSPILCYVYLGELILCAGGNKDFEEKSRKNSGFGGIQTMYHIGGNLLL